MLDNKSHSVRKRMVSNLYSKSYLQSSPNLSAMYDIVILQRLLPRIEALTTDCSSIEVFSLFSSITMDLVNAYLFGLRNSTNFIQDSAARDWFLERFHGRKEFSFWSQEHPRFTAFLARLGYRLSPAWLDTANKDIEGWCTAMCDAAAVSDPATEKPQDMPVVYRALRTSLAKSDMAPANANLETTLASELLDQLGAGNETSAITLLYLFHSLAQRPELQSRLRTELLTLTPVISHASTTLPPPKAIDVLPLLHACVMETLRLYASIPGPQPRITPHTCTLGPYADIPAGVRVSAQAWSLHRNAAVYADPDTWRPERWLGDPTSPEMLEMQRWFWYVPAPAPANIRHV